MNPAAGRSSRPPLEVRGGGWRGMLAAWDPTPLQIALVYAVFGFGSLYVSDVLFVQWFAGTSLLSRVQALKGGLEVVLTAGLLFLLARQGRVRLQAKNRRLERAREELGVLHRVLRHNLRNDVNVIMGAADAVREACDDPTAAKQCERLHTVSDDIVHYVDQAQKIDSLTDSQRTRTELDVTAAVEDVLDTSPALDRDGVHVTTDIEDVPPVLADAQFGDAFGEVLDNAVTHSDRDCPRVTVSVHRAADRPGHVAVRVADDGPGIPASEREVIEQRAERPLTHSQGLGLWFASWTALVSGGEFEIEDNDPRGTVVTFHLPIARTHPLAEYLPLSAVTSDA